MGSLTALSGRYRVCVALSLLVVCIACDANDREPRAGQSLEGLPARPGLVWAMTRTAVEGATEIVFDEIPQTADHIQGIFGGRLGSGPIAQIHIQLNGDTSPTAYNTSAWQFSSNGISGVLPGCGVGVGQIVLGVLDSESQYTFTIGDYSWVGRKKDLSAHGWAVNGFLASNMLSILSGGVRTGSYDEVRRLRFYLSDSAARFSAVTKITLYGLSDGS